jgi:hypothetical protein
MDGQIVRKFKLFWAWQDDREETWLSEMARDGLHLKRYRSFGVYDFERGAPRNDTYRLDYVSVSGKAKIQYLQLFADAGWTHLGEVAGWQYFRKTVREGENAEIFSDNASKMEKYRRIMIVYFLFTFFFMVNLNNLKDEPGLFFQVVTFVTFMFLVFFVISLLMLWRRVAALKKI